VSPYPSIGRAVLIISADIYDKYAEALTAKVKQFKVGPGFDEGVTHGPLIHRRQADKVIEHVEDAVSKGAKILVGGERGELGYVQPTVLANVTTDCVRFRSLTASCTYEIAVE
jgi:succinate-semialdehyde dehydrogenase/glutarate-semialdehyde dehydrogenase